MFAVTFTDTYPMQTGQITFTADGRALNSRLCRIVPSHAPPAGRCQRVVIELTVVPYGVFGTGPAGSGAATTLLLDQDTVHVTITAACERPPTRERYSYRPVFPTSMIHWISHMTFIGMSTANELSANELSTLGDACVFLSSRTHECYALARRVAYGGGRGGVSRDHPQARRHAIAAAVQHQLQSQLLPGSVLPVRCAVPEVRQAELRLPKVGACRGGPRGLSSTGHGCRAAGSRLPCKGT